MIPQQPKKVAQAPLIPKIAAEVPSLDNVKDFLDANDVLTNRDRDDVQSEISSVYMPRECRAILGENIQTLPVTKAKPQNDKKTSPPNIDIISDKQVKSLAQMILPIALSKQ